MTQVVVPLVMQPEVPQRNAHGTNYFLNGGIYSTLDYIIESCSQVSPEHIWSWSLARQDAITKGLLLVTVLSHGMARW